MAASPKAKWRISLTAALLFMAAGLCFAVAALVGRQPALLGCTAAFFGVSVMFSVTAARLKRRERIG